MQLAVALHQIKQHIAHHDLKKAEITIAKLLKTELTAEQRASILVQRARVRLLAARPEDAIKELHTITETLPHIMQSNPHRELQADAYLARFELASLGFAQRNDITQAKRLYQTILEAAPDYDNRGWIYYQLGRVALINDQPRIAETYFNKALFSPSHVQALTAYCYERLGYIAFYEARRPDYAHTLLQKAVYTYPSSESRQWLIQVHLLRNRVLRENHPDLAIEAVEQAIAIAKRDANNKAGLAEALFARAETYMQSPGDIAKAIQALQDFIQNTKAPLGVDVTWSRTYEMLGDAYLQTNQYEQAITAYENALQFNPYHPWVDTVRLHIAQAYYHLHRYQETISVLKQLHEQSDDMHHDYHFYALMGDAYQQLGHRDDAIQMYRQAIQVASPDKDINPVQLALNSLVRAQITW